MKEISSTDNKIYKLCVKLSEKKHRDSLGQYIIEGNNLIDEALKGSVLVDFLLFRHDYKDVAMLSNYGVDAHLLHSKLFDKLAQTQTSQGVLAVVRRKWLTEAEFAEKCLSCDGNVVILDRLQDLGNIGTIIRTADAAGYKGIIAIKGTGDIYSPKVVRAAAGSLFRIPLLFTDTPTKVATLMSGRGKNLVATCFDTDKYYFNVDLKKNTALIIGNEGNGISDELMNLANYKVKIPMTGKIDSLNAAVAAGILMYEAMRKEKV